MFGAVYGGVELLDETAVHPESYTLAKNLLHSFDMDTNELRNISEFRTLLQERSAGKDVHMLAEELGADHYTVQDIIQFMMQKGIDPRTSLPEPKLNRPVLALEDVEVGLALDGKVINIAPGIGAFVDVGLKVRGLIPQNDVGDIKMGQELAVTVVSVDKARQRVGLSVKS